MTILEEFIAQIRAAPTKTPRWFEEALKQAWKHLFPITPESIRLGDLPLDHKAWVLTPNPWWIFLTDVPGDLVGSIRGVEQAKEAIRDAPLGRIWMDHSREEVGRLQRDGHGSPGKSPNSETDPNHGSGAEMQYASELQGGHPRHPEIHDNLEARLGGIQGFAKKNRVEYGGSGRNDC